MIIQVRKRDGRVVDFSRANIESAIRKAGRATNTNLDVLSVTNFAIKTIEEKFKDQVPSVEQIQDIVEKSLIHFDCPETAKAYILYRQKRSNEREGKYLIDVISLIDDYIEQKDWRVKENANASYSVSGLTFHIAGSVIANYSLNKYPQHIGHAHKNGDIHIHDLSLGLVCGYCAGWDLEKLFLEGINGIPGKIDSNPANHLTSATWQMINFIGTLQNEWAGAQAFNGVDTLLAPFIRKDKLAYKQVKQAMQGLVFNLNVPSRWSCQSPFSNFTFDWTIPEDRMEDIPVIGGKPMDFVYGDLQEESLMINKAFMEVMTEGDAKGSTFTFPIPTINITKEFDWNGPLTDELFALTAKYGPYYFANFVKSDLNPRDIRSMCLPGNVKLIYKTESGRISNIEISRLVKYFTEKKDYKILYNGEFIDLIDAFEVDYEKYNHKIVKLTTQNNIEEEFSFDHKQEVMRDGKIISIFSQDIKIGDKLPLSKYGYKGPNIGDYELGFFIGCYIGDGYKRPGIGIAVSSHERKSKVKEVCENIAKRLGSWSTIEEMPEKTSFRVTIHTEAITTLIEEYVKGDDCYSKRLTNDWIDRSEEFRKGMFDGILETDGFIRKNCYGHKNDYRLIHTNNKNLVSDLRELCNSIGIKTTVYSHTNINSTGRFESYDLKILNYNNWLSNILTDHDDKYWIAVTNKEIIKHNFYKKVYNITVSNDEHQYELASSIITSNCCRLSLNLNELRNKMGGLFGAGSQTGSIAVTTINLPRLGYLSKTDNEFFERLDALLDIAKESMEIKRKIVSRHLELGLMPYTKRYLGHLNGHFSTIGIIGMNECLVNYMDKGIWDKESYNFGIGIMDHIRSKLIEIQKETGTLYNLEATPAEGTTRRLAAIDKRHYPNIKVANEQNWREKKAAPYYSNSIHLPVGYTNDMFESLDLEEEFLTKFTGGCVKHIYLGERLPNAESARNLVKKICSNYRVPYISITPQFSVCPTHGYVNGVHETCPKEM